MFEERCPRRPCTADGKDTGCEFPLPDEVFERRLGPSRPAKSQRPCLVDPVDERCVRSSQVRAPLVPSPVSLRREIRTADEAPDDLSTEEKRPFCPEWRDAIKPDVGLLPAQGQKRQPGSDRFPLFTRCREQRLELTSPLGGEFGWRTITHRLDIGEQQRCRMMPRLHVTIPSKD